MNPFAPTSLSFEENCVCRLSGEIHPACTAHGHLSDVNRQDDVSFAEFREFIINQIFAGDIKLTIV